MKMSMFHYLSVGAANGCNAKNGRTVDAEGKNVKAVGVPQHEQLQFYRFMFFVWCTKLTIRTQNWHRRVFPGKGNRA